MFENAGLNRSLEKIRAKVNTLAARISAPDELLPTFGSSADFGRPHIEVDDRYHWVVVERGAEIERRTTESLDELLYWTFQSITFSLASEYELSHRQSDKDSRRGLFRSQLGLLFALDVTWASRRHSELSATLAEHPFIDDKNQGLEPAN